MSGRYFHGGKAGLRVGDVLRPSPPHVEDGCPVCVARAAGRTMTVGEMRVWARKIGPRATPLLRELEGVPDDAAVDPPTGERAVYITSSLEYATWYAARSRGDLYRVVPLGTLGPSEEDNFPTWTTDRARIVEVVRRRVVLHPAQRDRIRHLWTEADARRAPTTPGEGHDG